MKNRVELIEEVTIDLVRLHKGCIDTLSYDCLSYGIVKVIISRNQ